MTRQTQSILLVLLGAVILRLALSDAYVHYVATWMKWPLIASAVILLGLAIGPLIRPPARVEGEDDDAHGPPWATWLLVLPGLITFVVAPPALGAYLAERRANEVAAPAPAVVNAVEAGTDVPLPVTEFVWRAQDGGETLQDRTVRLTGFVSHGDSGQWFVTRLSVSCCAADAVAFQVRVDGDFERPPRDQWVEVTGTYVTGSGVKQRTAPALAATKVVEVAEPNQTYG